MHAESTKLLFFLFKHYPKKCTETVFLVIIGAKVLGVFIFAIHSHLYYRILPPPPPPEQK
jgi:hypothetical protein